MKHMGMTQLSPSAKGAFGAQVNSLFRTLFYHQGPISRATRRLVVV